MNKKRYLGRLSICRPTSNQDDNPPLYLELEDATNGAHLGRIWVDPLTFFNAIQGRAYVLCEFDLDTSYVGKVREQKDVQVFGRNRIGGLEERQRVAREAVAEHEVDGWTGYAGDVYNNHRLAKSEADGAWYTVRFSRYVDPPEDQTSRSSSS